jgi:hypothetical protein
VPPFRWLEGVEVADGLVVVVDEDVLLPQAASTSAPTASPAPIFQAALSLGFRCMWLSYLPDLNDAVGTGALRSPFYGKPQPAAL